MGWCVVKPELIIIIIIITLYKSNSVIVIKQGLGLVTLISYTREDSFFLQMNFNCKGDTFLWVPICFYAHQKKGSTKKIRIHSHWIEVYLKKKKEFTPNESTLTGKNLLLFPFSVDLFTEVRWLNLDKTLWKHAYSNI